MRKQTSINRIDILPEQRSFLSETKKDWAKNKLLYFMILPILLYYVIFHYMPMFGMIIAFQDYSPASGIFGSEWVGFRYFNEFFSSIYFWRILKNTIVISVSTLIFNFPAPIILALMINDLKNKWFAKTVQTITYMPYFVSLVVICGIIKEFTAETGIINQFLALFGFEKTNMLNRPECFVPIYVLSTIWQTVGWNSIIFLAALTTIPAELYDAATTDGAGRLRKIWHVSLPGIMPTVFVILILNVSNLLNVGYEKIILLYNPVTYETADVISTFVYRKGLLELNWSYSTAVGLFNSVINFAILILSNTISKRVNDTSLW